MWWRRKFEANARRDISKVTQLRQLGYTVLVVWECEVAKPNVLTKRLRCWRKAMLAQLRHGRTERKSLARSRVVAK